MGQFSWLQTAQEAFSRVRKSLTPQYEIKYCTKKGQFCFNALDFFQMVEPLQKVTKRGSYGQLKTQEARRNTIVYKESGGERGKKKYWQRD